jgi:hypothetical protein
MRIPFLFAVFLFSSSPLFAQQLPTWYRVYTFDESIIEMNTAQVTFGGKDVARVRFRWTFNQPEVVSGEPQLRFKRRLEVIEFNCSAKRFRPFDITLFDSAGKLVRHDEVNPPAEWRAVISGSMMEKLLVPACALIERRTHPPAVASDEKDLEKVSKFVRSFVQRLEQTKDFKPVVEKFFAADYLDGYLHDGNTNWFLNLNRETAASASRAELQRFYVALLNSGYLSFVYLLSQYPYAAEGGIPEEKLIPPDVLEFIDNHPYTAKYKRRPDSYDFLAENIDSVERLRSYIDLLEGIAGLMRRRVTSVGPENSRDYQRMLEDLDAPTASNCAADCLGLPKGTQIFDVSVPLFHLQVAEIKGELKVISAIDSSH